MNPVLFKITASFLSIFDHSSVNIKANSLGFYKVIQTSPGRRSLGKVGQLKVFDHFAWSRGSEM